MSEYTDTAVLCDNCYPDFLPSFTFFRLEAVKGVFRGHQAEALKDGWEECDFGILCPDCSAKIKTEESEEGEMVHGHQALMDNLGLEDEE